MKPVKEPRVRLGAALAHLASALASRGRAQTPGLELGLHAAGSRVTRGGKVIGVFASHSTIALEIGGEEERNAAKNSWYEQAKGFLGDSFHGNKMKSFLATRRAWAYENLHPDAIELASGSAFLSDGATSGFAVFSKKFTWIGAALVFFQPIR